MAIGRSEVIARSRKAFREGVSFAKFQRQMRKLGYVRRRSEFLADWRTINEIEKKEGTLRYVRKGYYPAKTSIAQVEWSISKEYMYKVRTKSRLRPDEPLTIRFVNIMSDSPLTPAEIEALAWEMIEEQSPKRIGQVEAVTGWSAAQRII